MVADETELLILLSAAIISSIAFPLIAETMPERDMALFDRHSLPAPELAGKFFTRLFCMTRQRGGLQ